MFGGLRQGSLLYVLDKTANGAKLRIAQVDNISNPTPRYGQMAQYGGGTDMVVDVRARVGEEAMEFKQLSSAQSIANSGAMVICDSKEVMSAEVDALMRTSKQVLESITYHEKVLADCEAMMRELNPQLAKEKEQEEKIDALESKMGNIEGALNKIQTMLSNLTDKN